MTADFKTLFKSAEPLNTIQAQNANAVVRDVARSLVAGLGVGAAGAGVAQLGKMWNRGQEKDKSPYPTVLTTPMPFPAQAKLAFIRFGRRPKKKNTAKGKKQFKRGEDENIYKEAAFGLPEFKPGDQTPFFMDNSVSNPQSVPSYWPGVAMAAGAGLYGGYKGLSGIFNHDDKAQKQHEIDEAKQQFEQALLSSYPKPKSTIAPSAGVKLGMALDAMYDTIGADQAEAFVKVANDRAGITMGAMTAQLNGATPFSGNDRLGKLLERTKIREEKKHEPAWQSLFGFGEPKEAGFFDSQSWANAWGQGKGLYGIYAMGTALPAALATYNAVRSSGQDQTMDAVMKAHHRAQYAQSPTQIMAVPKPVFDQSKNPNDALTGGQTTGDTSDPEDYTVAA